MLKIYSCRAETNPGLVDPIPGYLFALARTGLNVADPRTHDAAYDHLERAVVILRIGEDVDPKPSETYQITSAVSRARFITSRAHCIRAGSMDRLCGF
jgi:hypothetical protein